MRAPSFDHARFLSSARQALPDAPGDKQGHAPPAFPRWTSAQAAPAPAISPYPAVPHITATLHLPAPLKKAATSLDSTAIARRASCFGASLVSDVHAPPAYIAGTPAPCLVLPSLPPLPLPSRRFGRSVGVPTMCPCGCALVLSWIIGRSLVWAAFGWSWGPLRWLCAWLASGSEMLCGRAS